MQVGVRLAQRSLREVAEAARRAEALGLDALLTGENRHDAFLPHAIAAVQTSRVALATAVAIAFPRSPMVTAHLAHDLQEASGGRFVLGLGTQVKGHNERRFSVPWTPPVPRMREYVASLRAIWRCWELGEPLEQVGRHYRFTLMTPHFSPPRTGLPLVPVTLAAVGPGMLRLAGEVGDGVQLHPFCTRRYLERVVLPRLEAGLARSGMAREHFHVSGGVFIATGPDAETVRNIAEHIRYRIAFYGSTRTYWPVLAEHGLEELGARLHELSLAGRWEEMPREVDDDVLELFAVMGTHDVIARRVAERTEGLIDQVTPMETETHGPGLTRAVVRALQEIPSPFRGFVDRR